MNEFLFYLYVTLVCIINVFVFAVLVLHYVEAKDNNAMILPMDNHIYGLVTLVVITMLGFSLLMLIVGPPSCQIN